MVKQVTKNCGSIVEVSHCIDTGKSYNCYGRIICQTETRKSNSSVVMSACEKIKRHHCLPEDQSDCFACETTVEIAKKSTTACRHTSDPIAIETEPYLVYSRASSSSQNELRTNSKDVCQGRSSMRPNRKTHSRNYCCGGEKSKESEKLPTVIERIEECKRTYLKSIKSRMCSYGDAHKERKGRKKRRLIRVEKARNDRCDVLLRPCSDSNDERKMRSCKNHGEQLIRFCNDRSEERNMRTYNGCNKEQDTRPCNAHNKQSIRLCNDRNNVQTMKMHNDRNEEQNNKLCNDRNEQSIQPCSDRYEGIRLFEDCYEQLTRSSNERPCCNRNERAARQCNDRNIKQKTRLCNDFSSEEQETSCCDYCKQQPIRFCNDRNEEQEQKPCKNHNDRALRSPCNRNERLIRAACDDRNEKEETISCNDCKKQLIRPSNDYNKKQEQKLCKDHNGKQETRPRETRDKQLIRPSSICIKEAGVSCSTYIEPCERNDDQPCLRETKVNEYRRMISMTQKEFDIVQRFCRDDLVLWACQEVKTSDRIMMDDDEDEDNDVNNGENLSTTQEDSRIVCGPLSDICKDGYDETEMSVFARTIEQKLKTELRRKLREKYCAEDRLSLRNSLYCVANLCPCTTNAYRMEGPLVLGPFRLTSDTCKKSLRSLKSDDVCRTSTDVSTIDEDEDDDESFVYSDCINENESICYVPRNITVPCHKDDVCTNDPCTSNRMSTCGKPFDVSKSKCQRTTTSTCGSAPVHQPRRPIVLEHRGSYVSCHDDRAEKLLDIGETMKRSEEVAKWKRYYELVDSVLYERDAKLKKQSTLMDVVDTVNGKIEEMSKDHHVRSRKNEGEIEVEKSYCRREDSKFTSVCGKPSHTCRLGFEGVCVAGDDFDDLERFHDIGTDGFAKLCRKLIKWTHCTSKNWEAIRKYPYMVVHLPSMGYTNDLRLRAKITYNHLQNIQVGRIGWLEYKNVEVVYVFPTHQNSELVKVLRDLVKDVRPDIDVSSRLWMVQPSPKCATKDCMSGSENLFFSPNSYRRVRYLTAGRHAFILSGLMNQKDVFIACELKVPIIGVPLKFQRKLTSKSYVMELLENNQIAHPPFLHVHNFCQLCKGLAMMALKYSAYETWLVKIDHGFHGYHTGIIYLKKGLLGQVIRNAKRTCRLNEEYFSIILIELLRSEIHLQEHVYKNNENFFYDLEKHGGIIQACPKHKYDVLSVGVFVEHDMAKPILLAAAEVIHFGTNIRSDMSYVLPQTKVGLGSLELLTDKIGEMLRIEHVIGYFGYDVVTFNDQNDIQQFWIVDIDPYYTDLIAFTDWVKFCIGPCENCNERIIQPVGSNDDINKILKFDNINQLLSKVNKHVICSGKIYSNGLSKYCSTTLMSLCKQNSVIHYDNKFNQMSESSSRPILYWSEKTGCMVFPIDSENRAISIVSINSSRPSAMRRFIDALKLVIKLSGRNNNDRILPGNTILRKFMDTL